MADNVTLNSGSGGETLATDDIGGVQHQRVKIQHGADGSATDVSTASPLPVDLRADNLAGNLDVNLAASSVTVTVDGSGVTQPVSNTNIDNLHSTDFDSGAGTDTTPAIGLAVPASGGAAVIPGDAIAGLKVDLGVDNDVTVTGTVTANAGTGTFTVDGSAVTQPVSAASLPLPTGAATSSNQTTANTSLGNIDTNTAGLPGVIGTDGSAGPASAVSMAGTETGGTLQELRVDSDGHLQIDVLSGGGASIQYLEGATDASITGTALMMEDAADTLRAATGTVANGLDVDVTRVQGTVTVDGSGVTQPVSGTVTANAGTGTFTVDGSGVTQPVSGTVTANAGTGTFTVDGSAVTQPISNAAVDNLHSSDFDTGAGTDTTSSIGIAVASSGGAAVITGDVTNGLDVDVTRVSGTVTVDGSGVTQPISAASLPLPTGAATSANQSTGNTTLSNIRTAVQIIDNTIFADDAAFTLGTSSVNVAGAIRDDALTTLTAVEGDAVPLRVGSTGALHVAIEGTATVDGSAVTQPVSAVSLPLPTGAATAANQSTANTSLSNIDTNTTGIPGVIGTDGTAGPASAISVAGTESGGTLQELRVDSDGHLQIDVLSGGGGTQYTEAATDASITGTALMFEDAADTLRAATGTTANGLDVDVTRVQGTVTVDGSGVTQPVSGTVTANAGTGTFTVDGSGVTQPISNTAIDNAHSADFDSGAGTDTTSAFGIAVPASGGAAVVPGDATAGLKVDLGADNDVTVTGTVTANAGTGTFTVDGSGVTQPISGTVTADAGTGPWPVTDNSGSLTVDHTELDLLHTADFDSGAGTDTTPAIGIAVPASGGAAVVPGDATSGLKVDLGADNDVTVTGTVTVDGSGVTQPISAASLPLPTGAATAANQSTANTSLSNIETAVQVIDNAIFADDAAFTLGSSSVDVAGAIRDDSLTTLTAVEGDAVPLRVSANGALHVTGGGGGTEYVEDAAAPADPTGTVAVFVRDDVPVSHAADGDWVAQRGTQYGAGCVQVVTSTGSFVDSFGGSGGTSHADDAAFTIGSASSITPTGYLADETTPDSVDEGDVGVPRMTLNRKAYAVLADPTAENSAGVDASGHLQVDIAADSAGLATQATVTDIETNTDSLAVIGGGAEAGALRVTLANDSTGLVSVDDGGASLTVDNGGTFAVQAAVDELPAAAALADAAANPTTTTVGAGMLMYNGVTWDRVRGTTANGLDVDVTASVLPTGAATQATLSDVETNTDSLAVTGNGTAAGAVRVTVASDTTGVLSVDDNGASLTVDNGGVFAVQEDGAALTALQLIDDAIYADDAAFTLTTSKVAAVGAIRDDALTTLTAVENDVVPLRVGSTGALHVDGSGATQPVSGTITANLSATDNAVLDQIDSNTDYGAVTGGGVEAGALRVTLASDSTGQITVNGTVTANAGTGTMTVDTELPAAAALADAAGNPTTSIAGSALLQFNGTTWDRARGDTTNGIDVDVTRVSGTVTVDGSGVTQPVSNAGTFSTQVDGDALTALQLIDDIVYTDDTSTHATGTSKGALIMGAATPTDGTVEANDIGAVAMSTDRRLLVDAQLAGSDITLNVDGSGATQPVSGTVTANLSATDNAVLDQIEVNTSYGDNLGNGTAAGSLRVSLASDSTGQVTVTGSLPAGTNNIGDVDIASALPAGTNLVGDVGLSGARTSGGTTPHYNNGTATETQIKGSAGQIYWIHAMNLRSTVAYLQLFNGTSATFIPGTTTPTNEFVIATQGDTNGAGFTLSIPNGLAYGSGITYFISTTKGGGVAVSADEVLLNLGYA